MSKSDFNKCMWKNSNTYMYIHVTLGNNIHATKHEGKNALYIRRLAL